MMVIFLVAVKLLKVTVAQPPKGTSWNDPSDPVVALCRITRNWAYIPIIHTISNGDRPCGVMIADMMGFPVWSKT